MHEGETPLGNPSVSQDTTSLKQKFLIVIRGKRLFLGAVN